MLACDYDYNDGCIDYYAQPDDDFSVFSGEKARCESCRKILKNGDIVLRHRCWRPATDEELEAGYASDDAECVFDENENVVLPDEYLCEQCGEIRMNLESIGYKCVLGEDLREDMAEYHSLTGFKKEMD